MNGYLDEFNGFDNLAIWANEKFQSKHLVSGKKSKKSLLEYYEGRESLSDQDKIKTFATKNPQELGLNEISKTRIVCSNQNGTSCGGELVIFADEYLHVGEQEFYLAVLNENTYDYYGPFVDNLEAIVDEAKIFVVYKEPITEIWKLLPISKHSPIVGEISFESVARGFYSGHEQDEYYRITDNKEWQKIWKKTYSNVSPEPILPEIDFEKDMILAVFAGEFSSGGHSIEIGSIQEYERDVQVSIKLESPSISCSTTAALTQPFDIVKIEKTDKEIRFINKNVENRCD